MLNGAYSTVCLKYTRRGTSATGEMVLDSCPYNSSSYTHYLSDNTVLMTTQRFAISGVHQVTTL